MPAMRTFRHRSIPLFRAIKTQLPLRVVVVQEKVLALDRVALVAGRDEDILTILSNARVPAAVEAVHAELCGVVIFAHDLVPYG